MTGIIWFVQLIHYPAFRRMSEPLFATAMAEHQARTGLLVGPMMVFELLTAVLLVFVSRLNQLWLVLNLGLLLAIWIVTFLVQTPLHRALSTEFSPAAIDLLVNSNWIRTTLWSIHLVVVVGVLLRS
jgi:hypothetical protein